jgi:hypothetical protein
MRIEWFAVQGGIQHGVRRDDLPTSVDHRPPPAIVTDERAGRPAITVDAAVRIGPPPVAARQAGPGLLESPVPIVPLIVTPSVITVLRARRSGETDRTDQRDHEKQEPNRHYAWLPHSTLLGACDAR